MESQTKFSKWRKKFFYSQLSLKWYTDSLNSSENPSRFSVEINNIILKLKENGKQLEKQKTLKINVWIFYCSYKKKIHILTGLNNTNLLLKIVSVQNLTDISLDQIKVLQGCVPFLRLQGRICLLVFSGF